MDGKGGKGGRLEKGRHAPDDRLDACLFVLPVCDFAFMTC